MSIALEIHVVCDSPDYSIHDLKIVVNSVASPKHVARTPGGPVPSYRVHTGGRGMVHGKIITSAPIEPGANTNPYPSYEGSFPMMDDAGKALAEAPGPGYYLIVIRHGLRLQAFNTIFIPPETRIFRVTIRFPSGEIQTTNSDS